MASKFMKSQKFGSTKKISQKLKKLLEQLWILVPLQPILDDVEITLKKEIESKNQSNKPPNETRCLELVMVAFISLVRKITLKPLGDFDIGLLINKLKEPERECFINLLCRLAYLRTCGLQLEQVELSNELLRLGYDYLTPANTFELIDFRTIHELPYSSDAGNSYTFINVSIQSFLTAIYILHQPLMSIIDFVSQYIINNPSLAAHCKDTLRYIFGLAKRISDTTTITLPHVIQFMCQKIDNNDPVVDNETALLIFSCLNEAQDKSLCLKVHHEFFIKRIFSYLISTIRENLDDIGYYMISTAEQRHRWSIYCADKSIGNVVASEIHQLYGVGVAVEVKPELVHHQKDRVLISDRSVDYLHSVMSTFNIQHPVFSAVDGSNTNTCAYPNKEVLEKSRKLENDTFFNMSKDVFSHSLQEYSNTLIEAQYRKADHIWLVGSKNIRYHFYENVSISPLSALHWVKVKQPDGTPDLEKKFQQQAMEMMKQQQLVATDIAEVVMLNSTRFTNIKVIPLTGEQPLVVALMKEDKEDQGFIGFIQDETYFLPIIENARWKDVGSFDIQKDKLIGRDLPLPSKPGTESGEMTAKTAAINITAIEKSQLLSRPLPQRNKPLLGPSFSSIRPLGEETLVTENQIKQAALEAFDVPGQCFYGDGDRFRVGKKYTLPLKMPNVRVLREGGNGLVLEVLYEGQIYAVKRTAFRWRETLIMPKLQHKNILRLTAMVMGAQIEGFLRRRFVYHFFPKMTNDFGRSVGSFERYCLRTLNEKYSQEVLLLKKIHSNFKYVMRELLQGLDYLHTLHNPIIHRDIKPSNILVLMECDCPNPLTCVCRNSPKIILSDFDACLELAPDHSLLPDPARSSMQGFYTSYERTYHISPVGTIGFKPPEGFIHMLSNSSDSLPKISTKADIFSFGLVVLLCMLNEEGPKTINKVATLLLSINEKKSFKPALKSSLTDLNVLEADVDKILHRKKIKNTFKDIPHLADFMLKMIEVDPERRPSAGQLLLHAYLL